MLTSTVKKKFLASAISALVLFLFTALVTVSLLYNASEKKLHRASTDLAELRADVKAKNEEAARILKAAIDERDRKQKRIDELLKNQELQDENAQSEIDRLARELEYRPIRVRYITRPAGEGCGGAGSGETPAAGDRDENDTETSGVLPEANSRRLRGALAEVETLSAAYNSCRNVLINQ